MRIAALSPHDLSLRFKVPLRVIGLVLVTATLVTAALMYREAGELRGRLLAASENMGRMTAQTLVAPLQHDDLWRVYEIANNLRHATGQESAERGADVIMVLGPEQTVYVSTDPQRFPIGADPGRNDSDYREIVRRARVPERADPWSYEGVAEGRIHVIVPIAANGVILGTLVISFPSDIFVTHYLDLARNAALFTAIALSVLLPVGWYWGQRTAEPLLRLSQAMRRVGSELPDEKHLKLYESRDEIGQLGTAFKHMLSELRAKQELENRVIATERLAALGRLTAGIAHEVNNPLGGMLNAINTYKRHGSDDPLAGRTFSLLERGLKQVQETVGALLVQSRVESRSFERRDTEDIRTLLHAETEKKVAQFTWDNTLDGSVPMPATLVRQVLINLLLNAHQAIHEQGHVYCQTARRNGSLYLEVRNDGQHIPEDRLPYLFEPFSRGGDRETGGQGLGLWMTYQIVQQLKGNITVSSQPGDTRFAVVIPIPETRP